ncbi:MAG TPA: hypothetical protein VHU82_04495 [Vicinamibacterales bacterium]|nr:hypothetical protein [Vicinamibacterales bacterium]
MLLRLFPPGVRARFGDDVADHRRDGLRDARGREQSCMASIRRCRS